MMDQREIDIRKERELKQMIERLERVLENDKDMRLKLEEAAVMPSQKNVTQLMRLVQGMGENISQAMANVEMFEQEVALLNQPQFPIPEDLRSPKLGLVQHAVIQQIQRIDAAQLYKNRYKSWNQVLSQKIQSINSAIDSCLRNLNEKL